MRPRLAAFVATAALALSGCVHEEWGRVSDAQGAYDACVEEHGAGSSTCAPLLEALQDEQRNYEERSRNNWGCNTGAPDCPVER